MLDDMFKIVADPYLEPRNNYSRDRENGFDLLYSEESDFEPALNKRRPFGLDLCYPIPELKPLIGAVPRDYAKRLRKISMGIGKRPAAEKKIEKAATIQEEGV